MLKLQNKISGGWRSEEGTRALAPSTLLPLHYEKAEPQRNGGPNPALLGTLLDGDDCRPVNDYERDA